MTDSTFAQEFAAASTGISGTVRDSSLAEVVKSGRARYAFYNGSNYSTAPSTVTALASITVGTGLTVKPGWRFMMTSVTFSADADCSVELNVNVEASGTLVGGISNTPAASALSYAVGGLGVAFGSGGGAETIHFEGGYLLAENTTVVARYRTPGTTSRRVSYAICGYEFPADPNAGAAFPLVVLGDSISAGGNLGLDTNGRAYLGKWNWHAQFVKRCRQAGRDVGLYGLYAEDGKTLEEMAYHLVRGMYPSRWSILVVALGMNDAALANYTSTAQMQGWMQEIIDYRDRYYPGEGRKIVFCAPSSTDDAGRTGGGRIAAVRQGLADKVLSAGGASTGLAYVDWSQAFPLAADPTADLNNKSSERTAGGRVHPSGLGSTVIGNYTFEQTKSFLFGL